MIPAAKDFEIPIAPDLLDQMGAIPIDQAVDAIFAEKGWPLLGGASGRGWSFISTAQRCARLFQVTYDLPNGTKPEAVEGGLVPLPLQIGALFHTLEALYYAPMLGADGALVAPEHRGLCAASARGRGRAKLWRPPDDAPGELLAALKALCGADDAALEERLKASVGAIPLPVRSGAPALAVVLEAERLFDAHARHWGRQEDLEPLAIEWFAADEKLGYTCRYDMVAKVGANDPVIPPGVYIIERKSAKWLDEQYLEAFTIDGEILGQVHCWHNSDCEQRFGKLSGVVIDVVSKGKIPECKRLVLPPDLPMAQQHARWVGLTRANIALWRASGIYPQSFANCHGRWGRCSQWTNCALGREPGKRD